jgi:hypothetical protein
MAAPASLTGLFVSRLSRPTLRTRQIDLDLSCQLGVNHDLFGGVSSIQTWMFSDVVFRAIDEGVFRV